MKNLCFAALLWFPALAAAQSQTDTTIVHQIKTEALTHSQIPELAYQLTDLNGPRLTNSPGYRKAVNWAVSRLKSWNIQATPEAWGEYGKGWSNETATLSMNVPYRKQLIAYAIPWSESTPRPLTANVVFLDRLDSASIDKAGDKLKGKIVLVKMRMTEIPPSLEGDAWRYADSDLVKLKLKDREMMTNEFFLTYKKRAKTIYDLKGYLKQKGAAALMNGKGRDGTVFAASSLGYLKELPATLPEMVITTEDYLMLQRFWEHGQTVELTLNIQNTFYTDDLTGYNVVAEIPGSDPKLKNEVVMLGAHLDSWTAGTGATDNAAGCLVMLESMRILKALNMQPKRTIRLALWGGEEQVLLGSVGYVKKHFGDPQTMILKPEQKQVSAYFNLDNGTGKIRGIYLMGNEKAESKLTAWFKPFYSLGAATISNKYSGGSDQLSFDAVGIPAFAFIQDPMDYDTRTHHSNMDVYDRLSIPDLKQSAAVVAAMVYQTAMDQKAMPRKELPKAGVFPLVNGLKP